VGGWINKKKELKERTQSKLDLNNTHPLTSIHRRLTSRSRREDSELQQAPKDDARHGRTSSSRSYKAELLRKHMHFDVSKEARHPRCTSFLMRVPFQSTKPPTVIVLERSLFSLFVYK
jgi:hypothetical protein